MTKNILKSGTILFILILSFLLRKQQYAQIPIPGQSVDEYSYSWVGLSLIETGIPIGISGIPGNQHELKRYVNVDRFTHFLPSEPLSLSYPWMDHPPLLGLITGGYAYLSGARVFEDTTSLLIRRPIIIVGTLTVFLVIVYAWISFGFIPAVFSGLIYGTAPLVVLSSRMIQAENAIIPLMLSTLIFLQLYFRRFQDRWLILASVSAGLATLFKLTGVVCLLIIVFSLFQHYQKLSRPFFRDLVFALAISLPITCIFVIYGLSYGFQNFINITFSNATRFYGIGPSAIFDLIRQQRLTQHKFLPEAWLIIGWVYFFISLFLSSLRIGTKLLIIAVLSYLFTYLFFGSQPYGWYTFPFWPLVILLYVALISSVNSHHFSFFAHLIFSFTILGANLSRTIGIFEFQKYAPYWRVLLPTFILLYFLPQKSSRITSLLVHFIILVAIYLNLVYLRSITVAFWWENIS